MFRDTAQNIKRFGMTLFLNDITFHIGVWDDFVEYHSDRFTDYSLMVYEDQKLIAIMPANFDENGDVHSHQGLSYGGVLNKSP